MPMRALVATAAICASGAAYSSDQLVVELNNRLAEVGVAAVNAYLSENWETKMARLGRLVRSCDREALGLSVRLLETTNLEALQGHVYSLELAMGRCPETLLPIVPSAHVKSLCSINAYVDRHPTAKPVAEIDRRLASIRMLGVLAASPNGKDCIEAYAAAKQSVQ